MCRKCKDFLKTIPTQCCGEMLVVPMRWVSDPLKEIGEVAGATVCAKCDMTGVQHISAFLSTKAGAVHFL